MPSLFNVPNKTVLFAMGNHTPGEVAYCEEEKEYYLYKNDKWELTEFKPSNQELKMSAYDINKQLYTQAETMTDFQEIKEYLDNDCTNKSDYWLMYGREINYFTLFKYKHDYNETFSEVVFDCLNYITTDIKGFEILEDGNMEIWVMTDEGATVLYLFDYTQGVVNYG